jgi:hypothetical protein
LAYRNLRSGVLLHQNLSCQRFYVILWQHAISLLIDGINCLLVKELLAVIPTPDNSAQKPLLPRTRNNKRAPLERNPPMADGCFYVSFLALSDSQTDSPHTIPLTTSCQKPHLDSLGS